MNRILEHAKILVTGGAGFIGSNLTEALLAQGNRVTVLDNFSTGKKENLAFAAGHPDFRLLTGDIRDLETCREAVKDVDFVFHEAALGSVPRSIKDPVTSTAVNILGFVNMLTASSEAKVRRFIYAASSSTYGDSKSLPKKEDVIGCPLSPYAITKYVNELYAGNFHDLYGIDTIGLRYFNVFGRRQDPDGAYAAVIPKFILSLLRHERPVINGDGSYSRDFTYIDNIIQINQLAALTGSPGAVNQVYNAACGDRTTILQLFSYLKDDLAEFDPWLRQIEPVFGPNRAGDVPHSQACIGKAEKYLGYVPQINVKQGLKRTAEWYCRQNGLRKVEK